jgi:UDP-3-O-[3-hydroxymyristoyl] N-acetylglucosamine deacetylase
MSIPATRQQGTIASPAQFEGPGLHTGGSHRVTIHPAPAGHGIVFRQIDRRDKKTDISADWRHVRELPLCTCLAGEGRAQVRTVEHLLAACYACGIDNSLIEVRGSEIPIMDGSAEPWIQLIQSAKVKRLGIPRRVVRIRKLVAVKDGRRQLKIEPAPRLRIRLRTTLHAFGSFHWRGGMSRKIFQKEICRARSFGRLRDGILAKVLTRFNRDPLCQGANLDTVVALSGKRVVNPAGLRYPDEFARHRVLDLMGDLMLGGADLIGLITARSPVHRLNRQFVEAVFTDPTAFEEEPA